MPLLTTLFVLAAAVLLTPALDRWLGRAAGWPLAALYLAATATLWPAVTEVWAGGTPTFTTPWVPSLGVQFALRADGIGVVFALIAMIIGAVVFAYSTRYLNPGRQLSFYLVMAMFTLAMVGLVLADDVALLFVCWELTSLASFLLIARSGHAGEAASLRTLLITFAGGLALLAGLALIVVRLGTTNLHEILGSPVWEQDPGFTATVGALVLVAGFTKSAQFPFHVWLPDAMAAATPVSAYLHAAAVVKAGVFLLMRFTPAFHAAPLWNATLITGGLVTACLGAWFALQQQDLKKLMAYSTVSQLGLLVAVVGVGTGAALAAAVTHTIAHALFKSGLFMMVGVVDHATHTRDLRRLPQLYRALPGSFTITLLGCASMAGLPPLLGFVSKEGLLGALHAAGGPAWAGPVALAVGTGASVLTFAYCAKIVFGGFVDGTDDRPVHRPEAALVVPAALPILAGVPLGLAPALLDGPVGSATAAATPGDAYTPHLSLWHGLTPELIATLVIVTLGVLVIVRRRTFFRRVEATMGGTDGAAVIAALAKGLAAAGRALTTPLAVDHPARQMVPLLLAFLAVTGAGVWSVSGDLPAQAADLSRPIDAVLFVLIAAATLSVCRSTSRIAATVSLSAVGILATVQLLALGAPDVALTQLLVESLTVIVIMLVLQKLPVTFGGSGPARHRLRSMAIASGVGLAAGAGVWAFNGRRGRSEVAEYYIANTKEISGGDNIVNVILVEFRALDTMGELTVLGMAGVAVVAILSTVRNRYLDPTGEQARTHVALPDCATGEPGTPSWRAIHVAWSNVLPLQLVLRFLLPVLAVLSALIFWRGHNAPGGGFIAALVGSAAIGLIYVSTSRDRQIGPPQLPRRLVGGGVALAVLTGLWGLVAAGSFLQPLHAHIGDTHLSSAMLFDAGVYAAVVGLIIVAFNVLGTSAATITSPKGEYTRKRVDEVVEGELPGPLETVRGETPQRVGPRTRHLAAGSKPKELGR